MLVLTRKENESIRLGDDIVITVTRIQGSRVRFAIEAPRDVRIVRGELQGVFGNLVGPAGAGNMNAQLAIPS